MENFDNYYTGLEVNFVQFIFKRLNLMAQNIVSPNTKDSYYRMFKQTVGQLEPSSSDIALGFLPLHWHIIHVAEPTIPYVYVKLSWYVPRPNPTSRWKSIYKIFGSLVWTCFSAVAILSVIIMRLMAKY
jgi:hypothetical protein